MKAYHFTAMDAAGNALRRDGIVVEPGATETFDGPVAICESGLHASRHPFDALQYAPGPMLRLVECSDIVEREDDKFVCRRRVELARVDLMRVLRLFACDEAERVLPIFERQNPGDNRPRRAIEAARLHADGLATDDELAAARAAAGAAPLAAAWAAAWYAAWYAARAAAWAATRDAAWAAAWAAGADRAADRAAERKRQRALFARRVNAALRGAK